MKYMMDKINVYENKEAIIKRAEKIVEELKNDPKLNDSEKLMTIELAMALLNYDLYKISGDSEK